MTALEAIQVDRPRSVLQAGQARHYRWTRREYHKLAEAGLLRHQRVELINGEICEMSPMNTPHAVGIRLVSEVLRRIFGTGFDISVQLPLAVSEHNEPYPDIYVIPGLPRDFLKEHPSQALLVVEISDSTLIEDREQAALYAGAGIQEYWIVNLVNRRLEVFRNPVMDATQPHGFHYGDLRTLKPGEQIAPLAAGDKPVSVDDLLP